LPHYTLFGFQSRTGASEFGGVEAIIIRFVGALKTRLAQTARLAAL